MTEECPYCGKEFDDVNERGTHIAEQHTDSSSSISRVSDDEGWKKNKLREWKKEAGSR